MWKFVCISFLLVFRVAMAGNVMQFSMAPVSVENAYTDEYFNNGERRIYATGDIDFNADERLKRFVQLHNISSALIVFDSNGGSLIGGIKLGKAIRKMNFSTTIGYKDRSYHIKYNGVCASACAYAFAGGISRYIYYDRQKLGLHQFYNNNGRNVDNVGAVQTTTSLIAEHLSDMGIDKEAFIMATSTKKDQMRWLSKDEALKLNFANNGKNKTTAEIKIKNLSGAGQKPYLKIEQRRSYGIGKVLMYCKNDSIHLLAGIVTTNETSNRTRNTLSRNYLELDDGVFMEQGGDYGTFVKGKTLWLKRKLNGTQIDRIFDSNMLNIWTENGGAMRWGFEMEIYPVKRKIIDFAGGCNYAVTPKVNIENTLSYF